MKLLASLMFVTLCLAVDANAVPASPQPQGLICLNYDWWRTPDIDLINPMKL